MDAAGRWIIVHTKPGEEFFAKKDLERKGFEVFLPWVDREIRTAPNRAVKRERIERRAYFSRYLFVHLEVGKSLYQITKSMGVLDVVRTGLVPVTMDADVMKRLRSFATASGFIDMPVADMTRRHGVKPGQRRPILWGPFAGYDCTVEAVDKRGNVDASIHIFGRITLISVTVAGLGEQSIHPNGGAMSAPHHIRSA